MDEEKKYAVILNNLINFNNFKYQSLIKRFGTLKNAYNSKDIDLYTLPWRKETIKNFLDKRKRVNINQIISTVIEEKIMVSYVKENSYPKLLKNIYNPPPILYYQGNLEINWDNSLSVVGSRHPSSYGKMVIKKIISELNDFDLNIISGLAIGLDSLAHQESLLNNLKTIAVLGSGLSEKVVHPKSNKWLIKDIIKNQGLILSEFSPLTPPWPQNFPLRNRIIASLSNKTLVVDAGEKSGSLITSQLSLDEGREVLTVVGNIFSLNSQGTNELAKKGAIIITKTEDILNLFDMERETAKKESKPKIKAENETEEKIIELLKQDKKNVDDIIMETNKNVSDILIAINSLEIKGLIKDLGGKNFILS